MEPTNFPSPDPTPINEISPSLANELLSCQLRVGFARDPVHKVWRRSNTYSALGLAAHSLTEAAFKLNDWPDDPDALRELLSALWDEETEDQTAKLAKAWAPASPPPPLEWPGYALTRARTIRRAAKRLRAHTPKRSNSAVGTGVEIELRDTGSALFGRADRIEQDGPSTCVVDLKTGLHQEEPTALQRRQLLLYAVLVHRTSGQWPSSIAVEDASGNRFSQSLDPDEAEATLTEALSATESFNAAVKSSSLVSGADPDPERCRWCDFRIICGPFWGALTNEWGQRSTLGSIAGSGDSKGGSFVSVTVHSPRDRAGTVVHVSGLPAAMPSGASRVAITDWVGLADGYDARARWSTKIRTW